MEKEKVMEQFNWDNGLLHELAEVRLQLRIAEEKLTSLDLIQKELCDAQVKLMIGQKQLEYHMKTIQEQQEVIKNIKSENYFFREQNLFLSSRLCETLKSKSCENLSQLIPSHQQPVNRPKVNGEIKSNVEEQRQKCQQIAEKLSLIKNSEEMNGTTSETSTITSDVDKSPLDLRFFVGRLSSWTDEQTLREYFGKFGDVVDVFMPKINSVHRGFGFISFSKLHGDKPLELSGHLIDNLPIFVDTSCTIKDNGLPTKTLLVSGLIQKTSDSTLQTHFGQFGDIEHVTRSKENGLFARYAFVHFKQFEGVNKAIAKKRHLIDGYAVDIRRATGINHIKPEKAIAIKQTKKSKDAADVIKLIITNLSLNTTPNTLKTYFSKFGNVLDAYIPTVYVSGESKGYGFVVMPSETNFDFRNHVINGTHVQVSNENVSHFKGESTTLLVSACPRIIKKITQAELTSFFSRFGRVKSVRKFLDSTTKKTCHYAFVEFTSTGPVEKALENIGYYINGQLVTITKARNEPKNY